MKNYVATNTTENTAEEYSEQADGCSNKNMKGSSNEGLSGDFNLDFNLGYYCVLQNNRGSAPSVFNASHALIDKIGYANL